MKAFKSLMDMTLSRDVRIDNIVAFLQSIVPPPGTHLFENPNTFRRVLHDLQAAGHQKSLFQYMFLYLNGYTITHEQLFHLADAMEIHFRRTQPLQLKRSFKSLSVKGQGKTGRGKFLRPSEKDVKFPSPMDYYSGLWTEPKGNHLTMEQAVAASLRDMEPVRGYADGKALLLEFTEYEYTGAEAASTSVVSNAFAQANTIWKDIGEPTARYYDQEVMPSLVSSENDWSNSTESAPDQYDVDLDVAIRASIEEQ